MSTPRRPDGSRSSPPTRSSISASTPDQTYPVSTSPLLPVVRYVNLDAAATIFTKVGLDNGPGGLLVQLMESFAGKGHKLNEADQRNLTKRIEREFTRLRRG